MPTGTLTNLDPSGANIFRQASIDNYSKYQG